MNILHLIDDYLPGSQAWLLHLLQAQQGISQSVLARQYLPSTTAYLDEVNYLHHPQGSYAVWKQHLGNRPADLGLRLILKSYEWLNQGKWLQALVDELKSRQLDLLHAHFAHTACRYLPLARKLNLPLVVSFYGHDYEKIPYQKPRYKKEYHILFQQAGGVICEGPHGKEVLMRMGCAPKKIHVVPLGIPKLWPFGPLFAKNPTANRPLRLLQVADFTPKKGQDTCIQILAELKRRGQEADLTLIGGLRDPAFYQACRKLVEDLSLTESVNWIPFIPYPQLGKTLGEFDLFLHPSRYAPDRDCEGGAPVILLDAQAVGLPVIGTLHCDIPFVVRQGETGWLAPEGDVGQLTQRILDFSALSNSAQLIFAKAARTHVTENFTTKFVSQRLMSLYRAFR